MDALRAPVESAAAVLSRPHPGADGVVAAAAAIEGVRRALGDTQAVSMALRPRVADDRVPILLGTQPPPGASRPGPLLPPEAVAAAAVRSTAALQAAIEAYDKAAHALVAKLDRR